MKKLTQSSEKLAFKTETLRTLAGALTEEQLLQVVGGKSRETTTGNASRPTNACG